MYIQVLYTSLSYSDQSHGVRVAAEISKRDRWSATGVEKNTLMSSREVASHINQGCTNKNLSTSPRSRYSFNRNHQDTWILTTWRTTHHFFKENFGTHLAAHHCEPTMNFFLPLHCVSPRCLCPLSVFHQAPGGVSPANFLQIFRGFEAKEGLEVLGIKSWINWKQPHGKKNNHGLFWRPWWIITLQLPRLRCGSASLPLGKQPSWRTPVLGIHQSSRFGIPNQWLFSRI